MNFESENDNPLAQWAALVSRRANGVFNKKPADNIASAVGVSVATARIWLSGFALPDTNEQHATLMKALRLPHTVDDIDEKMNDMQAKLAQLRSEMEDIYAEALAWQREHPVAPALAAEPAPRRAAGNRVRGGSSTTHLQRGEFHDHPAIKHLRIYSGGAPYEDLTEEQLRQYLATTENAHEYLRCYRILKGVTQGNIEGLIINYDHIEAGWQRPSPAMLEKVREHVFGNDKVAYDRLVDRVIQNRLLIVNHHIASGNNRIAMTEKAQLPAVYWREALARYLRPEAWDARQNKPDWVVQRLETRGEYFRAIRSALGLSEEQLAVELNCSATSIKVMEYDKSITSGVRERAMAYFRQEFPKLGLGEFDEQRISPAPEESRRETLFRERGQSGLRGRE